MAGDPDSVKTTQNSSNNNSVQDDADFLKKNHGPYVFLWTSLFFFSFFLSCKEEGHPD